MSMAHLKTFTVADMVYSLWHHHHDDSRTVYDHHWETTLFSIDWNLKFHRGAQLIGRLVPAGERWNFIGVDEGGNEKPASDVGPVNQFHYHELMLAEVEASKLILQQQRKPCRHEIADARNPVVRSGYLCVKCGALFAAADHS